MKTFLSEVYCPCVLQLRCLQEECLYLDTERWWMVDGGHTASPPVMSSPYQHQHSTLLIISRSNSNQASNEQLNCKL